MAFRGPLKLDSAGWGFFLMSLLILLGPSIWLVFRYTYETATVGQRAAAGIALAAFLAAVFTWAVNSLLQRRALKAQEEERRAQRKLKKKRK